jgi:5-methylcytosine-specific restriction endonuclease McrA
MKRVGGSLPQRDVNMDSVPLFDLEARDRVYAAESEARRQARTAMGEERQREYEDYVRRYDEYIARSPDWRKLRQAARERDGHRCQICGDGDYLETHHLTYDHLFAEYLFEIVTLCALCHASEYGRHP